VDVAHNPAGVRAVAAYVRTLPPKKTVVILGVMGDKDIRGVLRELSGITDSIVIASPRVDRAASVAEMKEAAAGLAVRVRSYRSVAEALTASRRIVGKTGRVVVTGSFHTVQEALHGGVRET
jgi:dihydrofolate synthase/folylpolyglutamate synthase